MTNIVNVDDARAHIVETVKLHPIVLFKGSPSRPQCGFSAAVIQTFAHYGVPYNAVDVLAELPVRQVIKTFSDWPTIPSSASGAPSSGATTSCSKCTRQANLRKHPASIATRLHHDRPDGDRVGASAGAIRGDIWRQMFVGPLRGRGE
jgi:glutaredoxin-related protein